MSRGFFIGFNELLIYVDPLVLGSSLLALALILLVIRKLKGSPR